MCISHWGEGVEERQKPGLWRRRTATLDIGKEQHIHIHNSDALVSVPHRRIGIRLQIRSGDAVNVAISIDRDVNINIRIGIDVGVGPVPVPIPVPTYDASQDTPIKEIKSKAACRQAEMVAFKKDEGLLEEGDLAKVFGFFGPEAV